MKKAFILILFLNISISPAFSQQEIDFRPVKKSSILIDRDYPEVYKPTRLIIGRENKFIIKAAPGSFVSLITSGSNSGASLFYGQELRLGSEITTTQGIVPENGLLELKISLPDNKELDGKSMYFEVAISQDKDYSNIKLAKIMSPSGRETSSNELSLNLPPKDASRPGFSPMLPGTPPEMLQTMQFIEDFKQAKDKGKVEDEEDSDYGYYYQRPVILRNLDAPELKKDR